MHISDSMHALEAVRPSMFADITVVERPWLFTTDIDGSKLIDVLEELADYLTMSYTLRDRDMHASFMIPITGSMRSTPIKIMEEATAIQPLQMKRY